MAELTVGVEIEVHANAIRPQDAIHDYWGEVSASLVYFWDPAAENYAVLPKLNRAVIAENEYTYLTLEVKTNTLDFYQPPISNQAAYGKIEFITPVDCTKNHDAFKKSTEDILFILHLLYFFIGAPCIKGNRAELSPTESYPRSVQGFLEWHRHYVTINGIAAAHPPLKLVALNLDHVPAGILYQFPENTRSDTLVPRFAPQLTFSAPLERIPALFSAEEGTFSEPAGIHYKPLFVERWAVHIAKGFVAETIKPQRADSADARAAQKLTGFFTLVVFHMMGRLWKGYVDKTDARSQSTKDEFRFLLKSNLNQLYYQGLSEADRTAITRLKNIPQNLYNYFQETGPEDRFDELARASVMKYLDAIFHRDKDSYETAIQELLDDYTLLSQIEQSVPRKDNVHLERPIMEYRRLSGTHTKAYATAREVADALQILYNKLRFLESDVNPTRAARPPEKRKAYYRFLEQLSPVDDPIVNDLPKLELTTDKGSSTIEDWWTLRRIRSQYT